MDETLSFGAWIRTRRRALDLTQAELARRIPCAEVTVRKIEGETRRPSAQLAERLADVLGVGPDHYKRFVATARSYASPARLPSAVSLPWGGPGGIPAPVNAVVGRTAEITGVLARLGPAGGDARLLTLIGPPGVGKTRLAQEVAVQAGAVLDLPVVFVALAAATDPAEVRVRIAAAVAVPMGAMGDPFERAVVTLGRAPALLLLDNFEQVVSAAEEVSSLLARCSELTVLVTSRIPLSVYGEHVHRVQPLPVPGPGESLDGRRLADWPAVELFRQRAMAARGADLVAEEMEDAASICRLLDGLPLAIELAARQVRHRTPAAVLAALRLDLAGLGAPVPGRAERQQTIAAAVRWSYELLGVEARQALRAASVFEGGMSNASLATVAGLRPGRADAVAGELADHALVRVEPANERLSMLAVVRAFAAAELDAQGERAARQRAHAWRLLELAEEAAATVQAWSNDRALAALDLEVDDIVAALEWAFGDDGDPEVGCRLVSATGFYWVLRGRLAEGERWSREALDCGAADALRVGPAFFWAEHAAARDVTGAIRMYEQAEGLARSVGEARWLPQILGSKGMLLLIGGDLDAAQAVMQEAMDLSAASGLDEPMALAHMRLARLALVRGDLAAAAIDNDLALEGYRRIDDHWGVGTAIGNKADLALREGDFDGAAGLYLESVDCYRQGGMEWYEASRLEGVGNALSAAGRHHAAALIYGMVDQWLEDLAMPPNPVTAPARAPHQAATTQALGPNRFHHLAEEGRRLPRSPEVMTDLAHAQPNPEGSRDGDIRDVGGDPSAPGEGVHLPG